MQRFLVSAFQQSLGLHFNCVETFPDALESETEKKRFEALQAIEGMILKKYKVSSDDYKVIETVILKTEPHKAGKQWKFTGAFYYGRSLLRKKKVLNFHVLISLHVQF